MAFSIFDDFIGAPLDALGIAPHELPIVGGFFDNPEQEALQRQLEQNAARLRELQPQMFEGRMQGLRQQLGALGPANNMLAAMYGPGASVDMTALGQSPLPPGVFSAPSLQVPGGGGGGGNMWRSALVGLGGTDGAIANYGGGLLGVF